MAFRQLAHQTNTRAHYRAFIKLKSRLLLYYYKSFEWDPGFPLLRDMLGGVGGWERNALFLAELLRVFVTLGGVIFKCVSASGLIQRGC